MSRKRIMTKNLSWRQCPVTTISAINCTALAFSHFCCGLCRAYWKILSKMASKLQNNYVPSILKGKYFADFAGFGEICDINFPRKFFFSFFREITFPRNFSNSLLAKLIFCEI